MSMPPIGQGSTPATVLTINVKGFQLSDGGEIDDRALDAIERYIERVDPDVVLFQELDRGTERAHGRDTIAEISERIDGTDSVFAKAIEHQGGEYGVGIVTRNGALIGDSEVVQLPRGSGDDADREQRVALVAPVTLASGQELTAITTHLANKAPGRDRQLERLDDIVDDIHGPIVLGGDFNARRGEVERHLGDSVTHVSELTDDIGNTKIDHLYVSDGISVSGASLDSPERVEGGWLPTWLGGNQVHATDHPALQGRLLLP